MKCESETNGTEGLFADTPNVKRPNIQTLSLQYQDNMTTSKHIVRNYNATSVKMSTPKQVASRYHRSSMMYTYVVVYGQ